MCAEPATLLQSGLGTCMSNYPRSTEFAFVVNTVEDSRRILKAEESPPSRTNRHTMPVSSRWNGGSTDLTTPAVKRLRQVSPKQPPGRRHKDWYPYYAGFPERFVNAVIDAYMPAGARLLDPWSGSGTTTTVCTKRGLHSIGIDINPALTVIARARLTPQHARSLLEKTGPQILSLARSRDSGVLPDDLLTGWLRPSSASRIRAIQEAIHLLHGHPPNEDPPQQLQTFVDGLSPQMCFFYSALFLTVREFVSPFRTTNPTWFKRPKSYRRRVGPSWDTICDTFSRSAQYLAVRLSVSSSLVDSTGSAVLTGSAISVPYDRDSFDGIISSPPYATRIDYVTATLPELSALGADLAYVKSLRRTVMGSPVAQPVPYPHDDHLTSPSACDVLRTIRSHESKASEAYYLPRMRTYVTQLEQGLREADRVVKPSGTLCFVLQDSYYKEHRIDLQQIVNEVLEMAGRRLSDRIDYSVRTLRSRPRTSSNSDRQERTYHETLLVFQ